MERIWRKEISVDLRVSTFCVLLLLLLLQVADVDV